MTERAMRGGYFYPLDFSAALDPARSRRYVASCVRRALLEPTSARNAARSRALAAIARAQARVQVEVPTPATRRASELLRQMSRERAQAP